MKEKVIKGALPSAIFTILIDALGIGILIPIFTSLVIPGAGKITPDTWTPGQGFIMLGWLTATYSIFTFFAAPILGQLSDRYGRRPVLAYSLLGTALGYVLFAIGIITKNIPLLFASRALDGITGGNISVARAIIGDISNEKNRTRNFALIGAMFGLGFVAGPYLGGKLSVPNIDFYGLFNTPSWFDNATPFWFAAIAAGLNALQVFIRLPETLLNRVKDKLDWGKAVQNLHKAFKLPGINVLFMTNFFQQAGFTFFTTFFGIFLAERLKFTPSNIADFFSVIGLWIAVIQAAITPFIAKRLKDYQVLRFAYFGSAFALFGFFIPNSREQLLLMSPILPLFIGLLQSNSITLVSRTAGKEIQGEVQGINSSVEAVAQAIPAIIAGYTASVAINLPILVAAGSSVVAGILFNIFYRPGHSFNKK